MAGNSNQDENSEDQQNPEQEDPEGTEEKQFKKKQLKFRQIVIVRDQQTQSELQKRLGDGSLVFTILQSKGMEYDDVFLFDFFSSSPCLSSYRSLEELLNAGASPLYGATHMVCFEITTSLSSRVITQIYAPLSKWHWVHMLTTGIGHVLGIKGTSVNIPHRYRYRFLIYVPF